MTDARVLAGAEPEDGARIDEAVGALRSGELLVHPTTSVYGLGGVPAELDAEIARLKGRSARRPLLRLGDSVEAIRRAHPRLRWTGAAESVAAALWPGPLTLVLDDGSEHGLGVRVEAHPLTRTVLRRLGATMSSTSLNRTGGAPARTPEEVRRTLTAMPEGGTPVVWLEAGPLAGPPPSTVLSLRGGDAAVLREGALPVERIARVLGREPARG